MFFSKWLVLEDVFTRMNPRCSCFTLLISTSRVSEVLQLDSNSETAAMKSTWINSKGKQVTELINRIIWRQQDFTWITIVWISTGVLNQTAETCLRKQPIETQSITAHTVSGAADHVISLPFEMCGVWCGNAWFICATPKATHITDKPRLRGSTIPPSQQMDWICFMLTHRHTHTHTQWKLRRYSNRKGEGTFLCYCTTHYLDSLAQRPSAKWRESITFIATAWRWKEKFSCFILTRTQGQNIWNVITYCTTCVFIY